jgi:glycosyltransferase involved in cell wall biosynthesis
MDRIQHTIVSLSGDLSGQSRLDRSGGVRLINASFKAGSLGHGLALFHLLSRLKPNLVLTYGWGGIDGLAAARLCGLRRVIHGEDGFLPDEAREQKPARLLARRLALRTARRLVCPSRTLVHIARRIWHVPPGKIRFVPNGIDTARFSPASAETRAAARTMLGSPGDDLLIGTVGHLRPEKNHGRLLRAFAQIAADRRCRLLIVGDGSERSDLEHLTNQLGIRDRVLFAGAHADPAPCYHAIDLFALSSDTEQMPIALLEAMSTALPVVSTGVGDVAKMVSRPNQDFVTPLGDDRAFAAAMARLVDGAELRQSLGQANRARCLEDFDLGSMIQTYVNLYEETLGAEVS